MVMITAKEEGVSKNNEPLPSFLTSTSTTTISKLLFIDTNKLWLGLGVGCVTDSVYYAFSRIADYQFQTFL